jgi:NAD(P)-dependent dehydrogenase (short-subunit alcohol dehydrogenase family)
MNIDLSGKTALVTGSTAGIGHAIAKGLAGSGASVVINGRGQDKVDAAVRKLEGAGGKVRGIAADVSTAAGCKALAAALTSTSSSTMPASSSRGTFSTFRTRTGAAFSRST